MNKAVHAWGGWQGLGLGLGCDKLPQTECVISDSEGNGGASFILPPAGFCPVHPPETGELAQIVLTECWLCKATTA